MSIEKSQQLNGRSAAVALAFGCFAAFLPVNANAQLPYVPPISQGADPLDMLETLKRAQEAGILGRNFECAAGFALTALGWSCRESGSTMRGHWTDAPFVSLERRRIHGSIYVCRRATREQECRFVGPDGYHLSQEAWAVPYNRGILVVNERLIPEDTFAAVDAIAYFGTQREVRDPAGDAEFLGVLRDAAPIFGRAEDLRRVQVQVEAAVRSNRTIAAARLYRDALRTAPAWAPGHFNLGLLYGELELTPKRSPRCGAISISRRTHPTRARCRIAFTSGRPHLRGDR